jgi:hypothetical protein
MEAIYFPETYCQIFGVIVTNNNGFWIWWLDLLTLLLQSLLITINYSTIANLPSSQIARTCSILFLVLFCTFLSLYSQLLPASEFASLITTLRGPKGKYSLYFWRSFFTVSLLSNLRIDLKNVSTWINMLGLCVNERVRVISCHRS